MPYKAYVFCYTVGISLFAHAWLADLDKFKKRSREKYIQVRAFCLLLFTTRDSKDRVWHNNSGNLFVSGLTRLKRRLFGGEKIYKKAGTRDWELFGVPFSTETLKNFSGPRNIFQAGFLSIELSQLFWQTQPYILFNFITWFLATNRSSRNEPDAGSVFGPEKNCSIYFSIHWL